MDDQTRRILSILKDVAIVLNLAPAVVQATGNLYCAVIEEIEGKRRVSDHTALVVTCLSYAVRRERQNPPITVAEIVRAFQQLGHQVGHMCIFRDKAGQGGIEDCLRTDVELPGCFGTYNAEDDVCQKCDFYSKCWITTYNMTWNEKTRCWEVA